MPQDPTPANDYTEHYLRSMLSLAGWHNGARRVFVTLFESDTAWTPTGTVDGPAVITWVQYEDKSIDAVITR